MIPLSRGVHGIEVDRVKAAGEYWPPAIAIKTVYYGQTKERRNVITVEIDHAADLIREIAHEARLKVTLEAEGE
jgi:hypothetical protein